jgi:uncharacterized SAM-binding protein YcdF (DUF218 family)
MTPHSDADAVAGAISTRDLLVLVLQRCAWLVAFLVLIGWIAMACGPSHDRTWLWFGSWAYDRPMGRALVAIWALAMVAHPWLPRIASAPTRALSLAVGLGALTDACAYFHLLTGGMIQGGALPFSVLLGVTLTGWAALARSHLIEAHPWKDWTITGSAALLVISAQLLCFGTTDYRRPADAIVVLGAAVRGDGTPSPALSDRTITACALYRDGLAPRLIFSGGHGNGTPISEPQAMRRLALRLGIPDQAIICDENGDNTAATISNAQVLAAHAGWTRLLVVSHDYHLARIKLLAHDRGLAIYTVPAAESGRWSLKLSRPHYLLREFAAWLSCYCS